LRRRARLQLLGECFQLGLCNFPALAEVDVFPGILAKVGVGNIIELDPALVFPVGLVSVASSPPAFFLVSDFGGFGSVSTGFVEPESGFSTGSSLITTQEKHRSWVLVLLSSSWVRSSDMNSVNLLDAELADVDISGTSS